MSLILTYWENPQTKNDPEDYDGLFEVRLKSVKQIPELIAHRPSKCTMISTEHSGFRTLKSGMKTNFFKQIWHSGEPTPRPISTRCPLCGKG